MWRRSRFVVIAAFLVLAGACGSTKPSPNLSGFGATTAAWNAAHRAVHSYAGFPAYGPTISTPQGPMPQFTEVQTQDGRVTQYTEALHDGSSLAAAKKVVLGNLPSSAVAKSFIVTTSCAFWNLTNKEIGTAVGSDQVAVEMSYDDSSGSPYWLPGNINTLTFQSGRADSTDVC